MNVSPISKLREQLLQRQARLRDDAQAHRAGLAEPTAATGNTFIAGNEGAVADAEDELDLALWRRAQHDLAEVAAALARMDAGVYGTCERCTSAIALPRLRAVPEARLCMACQAAVDGSGRLGS
jgi:DnaK suppressor protein